jgi:hypothetical protein
VVVAAFVGFTVTLAGCSAAGAQAASGPSRAAPPPTTLTAAPTIAAAVTPSATVAPTKTPTTKPKPKPTTLKQPAAAGADIPKTAATAPVDGVPKSGNGAFTVASGGTDIVGSGATLVTYRVEVENGITWGANQVWTASSFASSVASVLADPRGWTRSAEAPITDASQKLTNASWSFQRVSGSDFSVRILLASPATTDKMCGAMGMDTEGVYSCRYGTTILINLRRWLTGAPGFAMNLDGYHTMVINHEMGHRLGFAHMKCPGAGQPAPVMQEETIDLAGCVPNAYPFSADGTFYTGPWARS